MADSKVVVKESDIKLNPLQVMSAGTPSAQMTGLANVGNVASTPLMNKEGKAEDVANTQIPTTAHMTKLSPAELNDKTKVQQVIQDLQTALAVPVANANDKNNIKFELQFLKNKLKEIGP